MKSEYRHILLGIAVIALFVTGCSDAASGDLQTTEIQTTEIQATETQTTETQTPDSETAEAEELTPYQFLCLICGNAETLSFEYTVQRPGTEILETCTFQSALDSEDVMQSVALFTAWDMNGNAVPVRELETGGSVHYIMDESRIIKTYDAPAEDFLMNRMCGAVQSDPVHKEPYENGWIYDYRVSRIEEDMPDMTYRFFMAGGTLEKLICLSGDALDATYVFSEFSQVLLDSDAFIYPEDYTSESFNYSYTGEYMPPWWEIGNDE